MSCWKRYQMLLFALMVWSIFRTIRFSLSVLFSDCVRLFAQPAPLKRLGGGLRARQQRTVCVQRAGENGCRCARRVAVEREHILVERYFLRLRGQYGSVDRIGAAQRQLLQHILLISGRRYRRSRDQRQRDADAFVVREEEEPVPSGSARQRLRRTHSRSSAASSQCSPACRWRGESSPCRSAASHSRSRIRRHETDSILTW